MALASFAWLMRPLSSVDVSPSGKPSSRAFSRRRMILPLRVLRQRRQEGDLLRRDRGAQPLARVAEQIHAQVVGRVVPGLQRDERLDDLADHGIGLADHSGLRDGRMLHQRALDLERPDQVPGGLDDVVGTADEPEVAVGVAPGEIAGQVPAVGKALAVALFLIEIAAEHRRPAGAQREFAVHVGGLDRLDAAVVAPTDDDSRLDAGQRLAHRSGLDVHGGDSWRS